MGFHNNDDVGVPMGGQEGSELAEKAAATVPEKDPGASLAPRRQARVEGEGEVAGLLLPAAATLSLRCRPRAAAGGDFALGGPTP
jgi:hypothetical protein